MKILTIHCSLAPFWQKCAQVLNLDLPPGLIDLSRHPKAIEFKPDIIFQQETLGPRTFLFGLSGFNCPKIFWSIDTHLNFFWHKFYGKNFDLVLTTQPHFVRQFGPNAKCLPWYGVDLAWIPWKKRKYGLSFVGRLSAHRPVRNNLVQFLQNNFPDFTFAQDIDFQSMLEIYRLSKLIVNECINGELNFRFFEALSQGGLLLTPFKQEFESLFKPGRELVTYTDGFELKEKIIFYQKKELLAKAIARAGYERILKQHLVEHRIDFLNKILPKLGFEDKTGQELRNVIISFCFYGLNQRCLPKDVLLSKLSLLPKDPLVLSLEWELNLERPQVLLPSLVHVLDQKIGLTDLELNAAGTYVALLLNRNDLAKFFIWRYLKALNRPCPDLKTKLDYFWFWAKEFFRQQILAREGFLFEANYHLPRSCLEWLVLILQQDQKNKQALSLCKNVCKQIPGLKGLLLQVESWLSLLEPDNWRLNLELAKTNWQNFRITQGQEELALAWEKAKEQEATHLFYLHQQKLFGYLKTNHGLIGINNLRLQERTFS